MLDWTIKYNLTLPPVEELVSQDINLRLLQRLLNLSNRRSNTASAATTANHKELNYVGTEKQTSKRTSTEDQTADALRDSKKLKSCKIQPKSLRTTPQTVTEGEFVPSENLRKTAINSDVRSTKEESISSSFLRMAEVLRKYKRQEPSTSENKEFEPRIFTDKRTDGNSPLPLSGEGTSVAQTVFDITVTAVKQLNNGNGSTVFDIVSYVRTNLHSSEETVSEDITKVLEDATAAGFLTFANGKYKEFPKLIEEHTSKESSKRKTTVVNESSKSPSKRQKPIPAPPTSRLSQKIRI
ncbi:hypothetical protein AVEN_126884-1 [Araneus ventricosus]|uniref:H15 domain-containing protein n=1 Tax=Araneus ventricosus TaxID=182803 RepID=A0A4Y2C2X7_ARAVE|nr:hypothetical protein AVEN_126884-1 [Araneus ventricosus]